MGGASAGVYAAAAAVLGYGGLLVARGELSPGALTAFLVYTLLVAMSLGALADLWAEVMRSLGAAEKVLALHRARARHAARRRARPEPAGARSGSRRSGSPTRRRPEVEVLHGVDLAIAAGEVVALVGPSGAGKTTLGALLCRLYDPGAGRVVLDGRDLRELDPGWLRSQMGVVPQEPVLFSASVEENVRYGRPGACREEVVAACRGRARARASSRPSPRATRTRVGERGLQLSGGQRQRIAIARAILKDPRILLLDEATSALDAESEALVQEALERLMRGRTTLVIAHRLSTVATGRPGGGGRRRPGGRGGPARRAAAAGGAVPAAGGAADAGGVMSRLPYRLRRQDDAGDA